MKTLLNSLLYLLLPFLSLSLAQANVCQNFFQPKQQTNDSSVLSAEKVLKSSMKVNGLGGYSNIAKFLIDVRNPSSPKVMFFDTKKYKIHHEFVSAELGYNKSIEKFQEINYANSFRSREFILASLVIKDSNKDKPDAMIELFSGDTLDPESIQMMVSAVKEKVSGFLGVRFHPLSDIQEANAEKALSKNKIILTKSLAANLDYIPFNKGSVVGYVKIVKKEDYENGKVLLGPSELVVFDQVPNDIGLVAGVVTAELQTPLSHINVKSINRGTANIYLKDAVVKLAKLNGRAVNLVADDKGYTIKELSPSVADQQIADFWKSRKRTLTEKPVSILNPKFDGKVLDLRSTYKSLPTLEQHRRLMQTVGAKAANLALLHYIVKSRKLKVIVPDSAALPFNAYQAFMKLEQRGLDSTNPDRKMTLEERVTELLNKGDLLNGNKVHSIEIVSATLKEVRETISRAEVPAETLQALKEMIITDKASPIHISRMPRLRFRSSTNSEDMEGFTGAGLYDSVGVNLYKKLPDGSFDSQNPRKWKKIEEDVQKKIPALYSSIFNERAFMEREWFGINGKLHLDIKAGIAIHGAFPLKNFDGEWGEIANGVAITTDLYREKSDYPKIFLNSQHYDLSITNPPRPEDLISLKESYKVPYSTEETIVSAYLADYAEEAKPDSWKQWPINTIRRSSIRGGAPVLGTAKVDGELRQLAHSLRVINTDMATVFGKDDVDDFPIDVEYKIFGKQRDIYIKQARPFVRPVSQ